MYTELPWHTSIMAKPSFISRRPSYMNTAKVMGYPCLMSFWQFEHVLGDRYSCEQLLNIYRNILFEGGRAYIVYNFLIVTSTDGTVCRSPI